MRNTDFISIHLQNSYKTDLLKYYKTLSEETKRFCKEGKCYFTKIFSALKRLNVRLIEPPLLKKLITHKKSFFWLPHFSTCKCQY